MWIWCKLINFRQFNVGRLSSTRLLGWIDPSPMASSPQRWFQSTILGKCCCALFWALLDCLLLYAAGYPVDSRKRDKKGGLMKLRPRRSSFWAGNTQSTYNYDTDWFDHVRKGRITVHHAEIEDLLSENNSVRLCDGRILKNVDAVIACTGWKFSPNFKYSPPDISNILGMPSTAVDEQKFAAIQAARDSIARQWPALLPSTRQSNHGGVTCHTPPPYRLFRFMVPPNEKMLRLHNFAFLGFQQSIQTVLVVQAQALWITAYLHGQLDQDPGKDVAASREWTYLHTEYQQLRRLGSPFPDLIIDSIPYIDLLLEDLGLPTTRKKGGWEWWRELVEQYTPRDYVGLVEEWIKKQLLLP
jgi:hypothetical protein